MVEANKTHVVGAPGNDDPIWARLTDQLTWYRVHARRAKRLYTTVKVVQLLVGATVPVVALISAPALLTASLAAVVVVAEGAEQLFQWHSNWLRYRSTAESLKQQRYLYLAGAGPYGADDRRQALAERVERIVSQETSAWLTDAERSEQASRQ
ncbi:DUF4231 domain-containing protein [Nocardia otitidiscaviarum]|uniref:DUF4231 domain-containing protein n=1 Tax=Nocardia otitidiscaviarum TaxID=1823 RepID=UPI00163D995A|nr:DUF4231 domain-containing protein [Nocardia otitidiscaviarum]MBF6178330.1 DUF4231 domain-containing protein [Nocardia otitidiscaviarum]MCP9623036.1 DUF4231 domain-containing protein [Nocardia otitidiscaviarum]